MLWGFLQVIAVSCIVLALIGGVTAIFDMMMNGAAYADWAPWGFGMAFGGGSIAWVIIHFYQQAY